MSGVRLEVELGTLEWLVLLNESCMKNYVSRFLCQLNCH